MRRARALPAVIALSALAGLNAPASALSATDGVLPVCAVPTGPFGDWYGTPPPPNATTYQEIVGQKQFVEQYFVDRGLLRECAAQIYEHTVSNAFVDFRSFVTNAVPNVIDAAGGDEQTVTVTMPNAVRVEWGQCLPRGGLGTVQCPDGAVNPATSGTILYRVRQADGFFRGQWTAAQSSTIAAFQSPGFQLQKLGAPCSMTATSCTYTVRFTRDTTNLPAVRKDIQLLLTFNVRMQDGSVETGSGIAVPLVIVQQGGGAQPSPGQQPTTGPATTGGGGSSAGSTPEPAPTPTGTTRRCVVPALAKVKLASAKTRLARAGCTVGKVSRAASRTIARGRVIRTTPRAGSRLAARAKVRLVVSKGR